MLAVVQRLPKNRKLPINGCWDAVVQRRSAGRYWCRFDIQTRKDYRIPGVNL